MEKKNQNYFKEDFKKFIEIMKDNPTILVCFLFIFLVIALVLSYVISIIIL